MKKTIKKRGRNKQASSHAKTTRIHQCSPKPAWAMNSFSCYTPVQLTRLRDKWNKQNPTRPITATTSKQIHRAFMNNMKTLCGKDEMCWLYHPSIYDKTFTGDLKRSFRPKKPPSWKKNPTEWLSDVDIENVLKQYTRAYKCFAFIGPAPIDFDAKKKNSNTCVYAALCNFQLSEYIQRGISKIGFIFNTDPHTKSGEHWISMFINIPKKYIFFFDSVGNAPPKEINAFVQRVIEQGKKLSISFTYDTNEGYVHQRGNTECGVYSLYVVTHLLEDKFTTNYLKTHTIQDKYVVTFRNKFFR